jgi:hypothetical protein
MGKAGSGSLAFHIEREMISEFALIVVKLAISGRIDGLVSMFRAKIRRISGSPIMSIESAKRDRRRITALRLVAGLSLAAPLVLVGCSHAPDYSVFGSFFPVWIFCSAGGLVLATGARALIVRTAIAEHLAAPVLFYLSMAILFACMLWLLFYS